MANANTPNGLQPYRDAVGRPYSGGHQKFYCAANLFLGDVVTASAGGQDKHQTVARSTAVTDIILGVVVGWEPQPDNITDLYYRASASTYAVYVCTDPNMSFKVQGDGAGTIAINSTDVGLNLDLVYTAGTTATGASNMAVDESVTGATAILTPLTLLSIHDSPDNEVGSANQDMIVRINMHAYGNLLGQTTGV